MKKLILLLTFLLYSFNVNAEEMSEERLFIYYKNTTSCAVSYNFQFKIAAIAHSVDAGINSQRMMDRIGPLTTAWVSLAMQLENELMIKHGWTTDQIADYRSSVFTNAANVVGLNMWHTNLANEYVENVFKSTDGCNGLAKDIRSTFKGTLDESIGIKPKNRNSHSEEESMPKKKM